MQNNTLSDQLIQIISIKSIPGYIPGTSQPTFMVKLHINKNLLTSYEVSSFDHLLHKVLPTYKSDDITNSSKVRNILQRIVLTSLEIFRFSDIPLFDTGKIHLSDRPNSFHVQIYIPVMNSSLMVQRNAIHWVVFVMNQSEKGIHFPNIVKRFEYITNQLKLIAPTGINTLRFLKVANEHHVPWRHIVNNTFQFGWGTKSRLFNSSTSDKTPSISVQSARDKLATAQFLRSVNLPVPLNTQVRNSEHAVQVASQFTYPVVIKPQNLDGGKGVAAGLNSPKAVKNAYDNARKLSPHILIEKHFEGNDHRLHVCQGHVYYATKRIPGGVIGDGENTINKLLETLNKQRINTPLLKQIPLDTEVSNLIREQGFTLESIPRKDHFVKLRQISNVSAGGTSEAIEDLTTIHKDNISLAIRAASVLRLDIAAIDFLTPDISRSWLEVGGIICEVNAVPQIGTTEALTYLLKSFIHDEGRIPVILIFGTFHNNLWLEHFIDDLINQGSSVGVSSANNIQVNKKTIQNKILNAYDGGLTLMSDPSIDVAILCIENISMLESGLPVDQFDAMVLDNLCEPHLKQKLNLIKNYSTMSNGPILINQANEDCLSIAKQLEDSRILLSDSKQFSSLLQSTLN